MYRLSRFFVSEITAGENLLRHGLVPIVRENGQADHGVLFAANGTCKTTLLSFLLNVFCPDQRRFVQHLQSGGDKTLEQYLIPGRPAVVLLELALPGQPGLFDAQAAERLVLGQLLYRHATAPDKVDRSYFRAETADLFDDLRGQWDALLAREQPYAGVRDYLAPRIQQTTSQKEWSDHLDRLGLDPWLIDRQIDFARTEGGIKDAFKFRSEAEFLAFFLGCVADMETAETLRDTIGQSLQKMADRPRKRIQLQAARDLTQQLADFDAMAGRWRASRAAAAEWVARLGEAHHLLEAAHQTSEAQRATLGRRHDEAAARRDETLTRMQTAGANGLLVQRGQAGRSMGAAQARRLEKRRAVEDLQQEETALQAAVHLALRRRQQAAARTKEKALLGAGATLEPMLRRVASLAARYHLRLEVDRRRLLEAIGDLDTRSRQIETDVSHIETRSLEARQRWRLLDEALSGLDGRIQGAGAERQALPLEAGETPAEARERFQAAVADTREALDQALARTQALDTEIAAADEAWKALQAQLAGLDARLAEAQERQALEARHRERLQADPWLQRMAGSVDLEPTAAGLVSRLDDALARCRDRLADKKDRRIELEGELKRLEETETLAVDSQVQRLIVHYYEKGLSPGELKAFPHYLAGLYPDPPAVARFIEADPGRFTGIMAATPEVVDAVAGLPAPAWLQRPVVVSTPCSPEDLIPILQTVIRPPDPNVYSRAHLDAIRTQCRQSLEALRHEIEADARDVQALERSSRELHRYQEIYPDAEAVHALADRVSALETARVQQNGELAAIETRRDALRDRKAGENQRCMERTADLTRLQEHLERVARWLQRYQDLPRWEAERRQTAADRAAVDQAVAADAERLQRLRQSLSDLMAERRAGEERLTTLEERAADVPRTEAPDLGQAERQGVLEMDPRTLRRLWEEAREDQRQTAHQLGIDALQKELDALRAEIADTESRLGALRREQPFDEDLAGAWAGRSAAEREARMKAVADHLASNREAAIRAEADIDHQRQQIQRLEEELAARATRGVRPDLDPSGLEPEADLDALRQRLRDEETRHAEAHDRLCQRCRKLEADRKAAEDRFQDIRVALAAVQRFEALWDQASPRVQWPDLRMPESAPLQALQAQVDTMMAAEAQDRRALSAARAGLGRAFDRLQTALVSDRFRQHLPALVDALRGHDAESLGEQAEALIRHCVNVTRNLESDLEISQRIVDNLVDMLLQSGRDYYRRLQAAAQVTVPEAVFIYGGRPILRAGAGLDFVKHAEAFRQSVDNWLHEMIQSHRLPPVNHRAGNGLGAELLYQLLAAATGRKEFGIRLLKCDDTGRNYEPVGRDLGSGGEALTTAVLLYALLISMRSRRRHRSGERLPAFLLLDNPLGVCNRSDLLDAQLKVARAMGIQCVYLTGINDRESLDLFELRVAIRKGERRVAIGGATYECLEITQLNLERGHDQPPA
jgi:hypothetical protein